MRLLACLLLIVGSVWANCFCKDGQSSTPCLTSGDCDTGIECICYPTNFVTTPTPALDLPENSPNSTDTQTNETTAIEAGSSSVQSSVINVIHPQTVEPIEHLQVQGTYTTGATVGIIIGLIAAAFVILLWGVYGECFSLDPKINNV